MYVLQQATCVVQCLVFAWRCCDAALQFFYYPSSHMQRLGPRGTLAPCAAAETQLQISGRKSKRNEQHGGLHHAHFVRLLWSLSRQCISPTTTSCGSLLKDAPPIYPKKTYECAVPLEERERPTPNAIRAAWYARTYIQQR